MNELLNALKNRLEKAGIDFSRIDLGKFSEKARLLKEWKSQTGEDFAAAESNNKIFEASVSHVLSGSIGTLQGYYFPPDLFGGCCPRVVGEEEDIVWNAAAEAADSERVHISWQAVDDKIWYLATRSADVASHPNTWCPFAALLPGQKDAPPVPACFTYYTDEAAMMMTVTADGLQVHRGTTSVLRVKAERISGELGQEVPIINLQPDVIEKMTPVLWYSVSLFEDRARRILAALSVLASLGLTGVAVFVWLMASMALVSEHANLSEIRERTQQKSLQLLTTAQNLRSSSVREQTAKFTALNDGLVSLNGYLEFYQIDQGGRVLWRAVVPSNVTSNRITDIGGQTLETRDQGVVIGNSREALSQKGGR